MLLGDGRKSVSFCFEEHTVSQYGQTVKNRMEMHQRIVFHIPDALRQLFNSMYTLVRFGKRSKIG